MIVALRLQQLSLALAFEKDFSRLADDLTDAGQRDVRHRRLKLGDEMSFVLLDGEKEFIILAPVKRGDKRIKAEVTGSGYDGKTIRVDHSSHTTLIAEVEKIRRKPIADINHGVGDAMFAEIPSNGQPRLGGEMRQ